MTWKVLVSAVYFLPVIDRFRARFDEEGIELVLPPVRERLSESELLEWIGDVDGVLCGDDQFTERVLAAAPRLKVISKWGTGIDSIDVEAASRRGIAVRNTLDAFTEPVADTVLGYVLSFARRLPWMDRDIKEGRWQKVVGVALGERTLGVIGLGHVGQAVVRRAVGFGMRVLGNDVVTPAQSFLTETGVALVSKADVLAQADFVSLNCDLNPTSHHIIGREELGSMKPTAYLINTARGPLIDEPALVQALREGTIAGAALDVFEIEPLPADSGLRSLDNCLLAPHNSDSSPLAHERVHENTVANLLAELHERSGGTRASS